MADKATITIDAGAHGTGDLLVRIAIHDAGLAGHAATFELVAECKVRDKRPVHEDKVLFRRALELHGNHEFSIPRATLRAYTYTGRKLDLVLHTRLVVDDSVFFDSRISQQQALDLGFKVPVTTDADTIVEPGDAFDFFTNLKAIPPTNRMITLALVVVGGIVMLISAALGIHDQFVPETTTWFFSHVDSDGESSSPLAKGLAGSGTVGAAVWLMIRAQLRTYMKFHLGRMPVRIRYGDVVKASSLFAGRSRVPLERVTLRVVASNMECGQYTRGSGTQQRTVSFREPVRAVVLYQRQVEQIPARMPISGYFPGEVDFGLMFATLYPPFMVGKNHGLDVHWEIQLLHPEFVDQELVCSNKVFEYDEFLCG